MSVLEMLGRQLDANAISQMSRQLGSDPQATAQAVNAALPMLVGALANNTRQAGGANALLGALDRDHDGSVLDDLAGFLGQAGGPNSRGQGAGQSILGHILGRRQRPAEQAIGRASGLDTRKVGALLAMLAPLVMGALARQRRQNDLGADGLSELLGGDRRRVEQAAPGAGSLLSQVIDRDGDGQIGDDLAQIGGGLLNSFLSRR